MLRRFCAARHWVAQNSYSCLLQKMSRRAPDPGKCPTLLPSQSSFRSRVSTCSHCSKCLMTSVGSPSELICVFYSMYSTILNIFILKCFHLASQSLIVSVDSCWREGSLLAHLCFCLCFSAVLARIPLRAWSKSRDAGKQWRHEHWRTTWHETTASDPCYGARRDNVSFWRCFCCFVCSKGVPSAWSRFTLNKRLAFISQKSFEPFLVSLLCATCTIMMCMFTYVQQHLVCHSLHAIRIQERDCLLAV